MKKVLSVLTLCLMSVFVFAQNFTMVPVQPQGGKLTIDGTIQLNINPYDPSEVQLEPLNGCQIAVPSGDQMYTIKNFTSAEMISHITSPWQYWTTEMATVMFDETTGYAFLHFSNGKYGYAKFDMSVTGGWQEFGYFQSATGVNENEITYSVYPNPATSTIQVSAENFRTINIYNSCGQLVRSTNEANIDVNNLESGIYFVSVVFDNGNVSVKKVMKK